MKNFIKKAIKLGSRFPKLTISVLAAVLLIILIFVAIHLRSPGHTNYLLVKRGFKIFKLGDPINKYAKYIKFNGCYHKLQTESYEVIDTSLLNVGDEIKIKKIELGAYNGSIMYIFVYVDKPYLDNFLSVLQAVYGDGKQPDKSVKQYTWTTDINSLSIGITLSYNAEFNEDKEWTASFVDMYILSKQKKDNKNKAMKNIENI